MICIDSHCHLEDEQFAHDQAQAIARMQSAGVTRAILAGTSMQTSETIAQLTQDHACLYGVVGVHPHDAKDYRPTDATRLTQLLQLPHIVGIGEIGLDYHYENTDRDVQKQVLQAQLQLAYDLQVPTCFHIRDAHGDMLDLLRARKNRLSTGVCHCFSGSVETAKSYLDLGYFLSFGGPATFATAHKVREVVAYCPLDRLLIETDSPYLAPVPYRGKRNEPSYVVEVAKKVAEVKELSVQALTDITTKNTCTLYNIKD